MSRKLILNEKNQHGQLLTVPYDGEIQIGLDGTVVVSDQAAEVLLTIDTWEDTLETPTEDDSEGFAGEVEEGENSGLKDIDLEKIETLPIEELIEIAEAGELKGYKKFKNNKKALATYVKTQLKKKIKA